MFVSCRRINLFSNKTLLITGGTGTFGNAVLRRFLSTDIREIRVFSRDVDSTTVVQQTVTLQAL